MVKKLYLETVGCQMNVLDSELVVGGLRRQGYELIHDWDGADVILFNTCSVRQHAEDKIYSQLGRLRGHKRRHPDKIIGVLGCMAQKDQELIRRRAPHVDIICGTGQLAQLPTLIRDARDTGTLQIALSLDRTESRLSAICSVPVSRASRMSVGNCASWPVPQMMSTCGARFLISSWSFCAMQPRTPMIASGCEFLWLRSRPRAL